MRQAQRKMSERKARRKRMALAVILLGHGLAPCDCHLFGWGAIGFYIICE